MVVRVEIISIGEELLIGKTLNTNAQWLSKQLTQLGARVTRVTTIGDDVKVIASAIRRSLTRRPDFILTSGGLGPTHDDKTLQGVAKAIDRPLVLNRRALTYVKKMYAAVGRSFLMTPPRLKMATIPKGSTPLQNPVGTAPAVVVRSRGVILASLPGVPKEMEAIFSRYLARLVQRRVGRRAFREMSMTVVGFYESELSPLIDTVMNRFPRVYVKSHPKGGETRGKSTIELHFSTEGSEPGRLGRDIVYAVDLTARLLGELLEGPSVTPPSNHRS